MQEAVQGAAYLREMAEKCFRLASSTADPEAVAALRNLAMEYLDAAERLRQPDRSDGPENPTMDPPAQT